MTTTIDPTTLTAIAPPTLLATLQAPRRNGTIIRIYADGTLAYQFPPSQKWVHSRLSVYSGIRRGMVGFGEDLTPEQFIERHLGLGYVRLEGGADGHC